MDGKRSVCWLVGLAGWALVTAHGCAWFRPRPAPLPRVLPATPSLDEVVGAVNRNSAQIHSFSTDEARLGMPGFPSMRTSIAFERPMRLRLRAGIPLTGTELDLGSNDQEFWIWIKRQPPMLFCRHDRFATSPARRTVPIEPAWLIEALGVSELDPAAPHQGPYPRPDGKLEIHTLRETADGPAKRVVVVDGTTGVVLEQQAYDSKGGLLARAVASEHRQDPLSGAIMPGVIDLECSQAQFTMRLALGNVKVNRPAPNSRELWKMPRADNLPVVDLGDPNLQLSPAGPPITASPIGPPPPATSPIRALPAVGSPSGAPSRAASANVLSYGAPSRSSRNRLLH